MATKCSEANCTNIPGIYQIDGRTHFLCPTHFRELMKKFIEDKQNIYIEALKGKEVSDKAVKSFVDVNRPALIEYFHLIGLEVPFLR